MAKRTSPKAMPREQLPIDPPPSVKCSKVRREYRSIALVLRTEGWVAASDQRVVILAAEAAVEVSRLRDEVAALPTLSVSGSKGQTRCHPLLQELRTQRTALAALYAALLLTPRSRVTSRVSEDLARQAGDSVGDELDEFLKS